MIGAGTTTVVSTTTTDANGCADTEQLPKTLLTLAVSQPEAEKVLFASTNGELSFGLLNDDSQVAPSQGVTASTSSADPRADPGRTTMPILVEPDTTTAGVLTPRCPGDPGRRPR